ncbi:MAG: winged helix-turn-helix domain-containing protein, partial [Nitrospiraceae bacterium]
GLGTMACVREAILILTSDVVLAKTLEIHMDEHGYATAVVLDTSGALPVALDGSPSLILVDRQRRMIEQLRRDSRLRNVPIIALEHPGTNCTEDECLEELDRGADASLCKLGYRELVARIRAFLRREHLLLAPKSHYVAGRMRMDMDRHEVTVDGKVVELTPKEFQILQQLIQDPSRVFSRDELLNRVWGEGCALEEHTLDVHIHSLRHKIEADPAHPHFIVTVRGIGYKLKSG